MDVARKAPLESEPFLVRGVQAQIARDQRTAGQAFLAAKLRDGRSIPARYFLAEHYFRSGDARDGLVEIAFLARMVPEGMARLAPYVASYARDPRNTPQLKVLFRSDPLLEDAALGALAADARNVDLVLSLSDVGQAKASATWPERLIATLISAGQYGKARAIWVRAAHVSDANSLIFDPDFAGSDAPPPFNWTLTSSTVGLAERHPGGGLHVIFYGQEDGVLASQLLLLRPGTYRLAMRVTGDASRARSLLWTLTCLGSNSVTARLSLDPAAAARGWAVRVPAGCPAQRLELAGVSSDMPQQADVTISGLRLEAAGG